MTAPPWKIKVVEPIALRPEPERRPALERAGYDTLMLRSRGAVRVNQVTTHGGE